MRRNPLAMIVFALGAILCTAWAAYNLWPLRDLFGFGDFGGGGISGLTTGIDALTAVVAPIVAFAISRFVRERTGFARTFKRAHVATTATITGVIAVFIIVTALGDFTHGVDGIWFALLAATFVGGALWLPLQSFFVAGFIGLLINERRPVT